MLSGLLDFALRLAQMPEETIAKLDASLPEMAKLVRLAQQFEPVLHDAMPLIEQAQPIIVKMMPLIEQLLPIIQAALPIAKRATPLVNETIPVVKAVLPTIDDLVDFIEKKTGVFQTASAPAPVRPHNPHG